MQDYKFDVYKYEKIEVYSDYIEKYKQDLPKNLAEDILNELNIDYYKVEEAELNPFDNPNPHMLIKYTIELRKDS